MAARYPRSVAELAAIPGVGEAKLARYGAAFLKVINGHD
jgi:superfamily II DNA helicase RecQ